MPKFRQTTDQIRRAKGLTKSQARSERLRLTKKNRKAQALRDEAKRVESLYITNGLAKPVPTMSAKAYNKLRKQWYAKLAQAEQAKVDKAPNPKARAKAEASKFTDIEWAENPDSRHVKKPASRGRQLTPGKQLYYAMGRNYLTHNHFKNRQDKVAWSMHVDGKSYREILERLQADFGYNKSVYTLFYYVQSIAKRCKKFNTAHPEGLLNAANQDSFASDALLADFNLHTASNQDGEEYGLQVDAGYWESVPRKD